MANLGSLKDVTVFGTLQIFVQPPGSGATVVRVKPLLVRSLPLILFALFGVP